MDKTKLLFAITQFFKGGAETALLNLFCSLDPDKYEVDFVLLNQLDIPGALSLVQRVPGWIRVVDAVHQLSGGTPAAEAPPPGRLRRELRRTVGQNHYHWAFHIGEWSSPEFVATGVWADHKAAWIHNDLNIAEYFDGSSFFKWDAWFERYLFVSEISQVQSTKKYPQLFGKSTCMHNLHNIPAILSLSTQPLGEDERYFEQGLPVIVTCANVRPQKNHLRQAEAMALLGRQGLDFLWLNVGAVPDDTLTAELRKKIDDLGLADRFLLLGSRSNPYPYMAKANAVAVLSDYESWSMVISEALLLGVPVIATKTSGALAQIKPENGWLVDFSPEAIAEGLARILSQKPVSRSRNPQPAEQQGLVEFEALVHPTAGKRRLLYLMDDINYQSGVQKSTFAQMKALSQDYDITVYSPVPPEKQALAECPACHFLQPDIHRLVPHFYLRGEQVLCGSFPVADKLAKLRQTASTLLGRGAIYEKKLANKTLPAVLETYDAVVVPSEGSALRGLAAGLRRPLKVQWIHTDYSAWCTFDEFSKNASQSDSELYQLFDSIVTLSPRCRDSFIAAHPGLSGKTRAIPNLLDAEAVAFRAADRNWFSPAKGALCLITIGRLHAEKNHMVLLQTAKRMHQAGLDFSWYMVGEGPLRPAMQQFIDENSLAGCVCLTGQLHNVYPLLASADLHVLFSHYEGTPVTIREAQVLGVPTLARPVGGIPDMVQDGQNGLLAAGAEDLYQAILRLAQDRRLLATLKEGAKATVVSREDTLRQLHQIFG